MNDVQRRRLDRFRAIGLGVVFALVAGVSSRGDCCRSDNFRVSANTSQEECGEFVVTCVDSRKDIARFLTGNVLPDWKNLATVRVTRQLKEINSGGGGTTFTTTSDGRLLDFKFDTTVDGTRDQLIESVLPHEVFHMVIHTITGHTLPRWLDEGSAELFESRDCHASFRARAKASLVNAQTSVLSQYIESKEYPQGQALLAFYDQSFTFVEWMLAQRGKDTLVAFLRDPGSPSAKMPRYYGLSMPNALHAWRLWIVSRPDDCDGAHCYMHNQRLVARVANRPIDPNKPTLFVVSPKWFCWFCWLAHHDYEINKSGLKVGLDSRFNVVFTSYEHDAAYWQSKQIKCCFPAFYIDSNPPFKQIGYLGPAELLTATAGFGAVPDAPAGPPFVQEPPTTAPPVVAAPPTAPPPIVAPPAPPAPPVVVKGEKGDKGDKGDPGTSPNIDALNKQIAALLAQIAALQNTQIPIEIHDASTGAIIDKTSVPLGQPIKLSWQKTSTPSVNGK